MELRQKIIHEALKLFSLKGYLSTSIDDILKQTKASKGGLYNHFKSKDELFMVVLGEARRIWREKVLAGVRQTEKNLNKIRLILNNYRDHYLKDADNIPGGCVFVTLSVELDDQRPDFAREIHKGFNGVKAMIKRLLEQALADGELRPDVNTKALSEMLFAGMLGASVLYGMNKSTQDLNQAIDPLLEYINSLEARTHAEDLNPDRACGSILI